MGNKTTLQILNELQYRYASSLMCEKDGCSVAVGRHVRFCRKHKPEAKTQEDMYKDDYKPEVYFILGIGTELVKIGYTAQLRQRLTDLQVGSPVKLVPITTIDGDMPIEKAIHKLLEKHRSHGEWFHMTDEVLDVIETAEKQGHNGINRLLEESGIDISQSESYYFSMLGASDSSA